MSKPPDSYRDVSRLFWSKSCQWSPHHRVHVGLGPVPTLKPPLGERKSFAVTPLSTQKSKRRWFCPAENDSRETNNIFAQVSTVSRGQCKINWYVKETRNDRNMQRARARLNWIPSSRPCAHCSISWSKQFPRHKLNPFRTLFTKMPQTERFRCSNSWP